MAHTFYKPHKKHPKGNNASRLMDTLIYPIALISPLMTIPQLSEVWVNKNIAGVSLSTWGAYAAVSGFWAIYGLYHKENPIIISGALLFILDTVIVLGVILNR